MISILALFASEAQAGISTTSHNLSATTTTTDQICIFCHTPHNGNTSFSAPLWNHLVTTSTFTMYTSNDIDMTQNAAPGGESLACLGCHDGSIAYNSFVNGTGAPGGTLKLSSGNTFIGTDLRNDHPVGVLYDTTQDPDFNTIASLSVPLYTSNAVECATCHDVHDNAYGKFLRTTNAGSGLCLDCHNK